MSMQLSEALKKLRIAEVRGDLSQEITGVNMDSRLVRSGDLFIAVKGTQADGHAFIGNAIERGATAVLVSEAFPAETPSGVTFVRVDDTEVVIG